jgi:hypothetical protein
LLRSGWEDTGDIETKSLAGPIDAGESRSVTIDGPAAVRELTLNVKADDQPQALRSTVLEISFDGRPAVWCPVGEFFGIGYRTQPYRTWYTQVTKDGDMTSYWVMPFEKSCRLTLHNLGTEAVNIANGQARLVQWEWDDRSMHFHTTWKQLSKVETRGRKDMTGGGAFDVNYVTVHGRGVYVGDTLTIFNGTDAWWGEGDEKIYVDGESFPSHFGTGTEDYYGYAWCRPEFFAAPFHAQPSGNGNLTVGFTANSRYRALDAIPFGESIKVDMELWHWRDTRVNYAPATFWYARPGAECNVAPDLDTAAKPVTHRRDEIVDVFRAPGAIEGETLKITEKTGGNTEVQHVPRFRWSNDRQLWWIDGKVGDRLVVQFPVQKRGRFRVLANLTKAVDYAVVKLSVNDHPSREFDRYHPSVEHDLLELGMYDLEAGVHRLTIEISGANEKAIKRHMFGLDYLQLTAAP